MDLYFVHIPDTGTGPDQTHELLALTCDEQGRPGAGIVMTMSTAAAPQIVDGQIGAIRWHQASGEVSEIYVKPTMRRQGWRPRYGEPRATCTSWPPADAPCGSRGAVRSWVTCWPSGWATRRPWTNSSCP